MTKKKLPPDKILPPQGEPVDKVDVYGWQILDKSGQFRKISKHELNIDHDYQRDHVHHARVNRIASRWSWVRFGVICVVRRPDGTYWVFDGQHRKLAADKRSDIDELPCIVFTSTGPVDESKFFLDSNCDRGAVSMLDRFKALVAQNDAVALSVKSMTERSGYRIQRGKARKSVQCVGVLMRAVASDQESAQAAWDALVAISDHESIVDRVFQGLYAVEKHVKRLELGSIADAKLRPFLSRLTIRSILRSIAETAAFYGKGGPKVYGEAVLRIMNKGRQHKIPSLYAEDDTDAVE